ncbi:MAG: YggS family pyridoxal phosphate-dependent enzyme [SAR324 cluster bacterium]|nr:YggS family pyridoxal phosphate-dependent enzyme [SAR324 cluster bacterium]MCS5552208.1 YggS family pyridoxal phosphate-dependent enzyme [SAR324 cluster bacterium]|tara:strand:+ start:1529 stop:2227 length:699 start_codon:yes stop_codon:yes gene_type:complete
MSNVSIKDNLAVVQQQLSQAATEAGRSPEDIQLIAVSKTKPAEMINEAVLANHTAFGENMVQEAISKMSALNNIDNIEWHLIGHLQKNKVKFCPGNFQWIHSIDSIELAKKLEERCALKQQNINVLIQVNLSQEKSKYGVQQLDELFQLAETLHAGQWIKLRGLMTIPAPDLGETSTRKLFEKLRMWRDQLQNELDAPEITELSMGMTADFQWAIQEGATMIRLGTAIFGSR